MEDLFVKQMEKKCGRQISMIEECGYAVASNAGPKFIGVIIKGKPRR